MIKVTMTGLNETIKRFQAEAERMRQLDGTHEVPINDLLTPAFVAKHTRFANADEFFSASGLIINSDHDSDMPVEKLDDFVRAESSFTSWLELMTAARDEWVAKKLA